jgi:hypothetical protein
MSLERKLQAFLKAIELCPQNGLLRRVALRSKLDRGVLDLTPEEGAIVSENAPETTRPSVINCPSEGNFLSLSQAMAAVS